MVDILKNALFGLLVLPLVLIAAVMLIPAGLIYCVYILKERINRKIFLKEKKGENK